MPFFANIDLFFVGMAIAATIIFGFVVFFYDRHSATNRAFLALSLATISWSVCNYLTYQFSEPDLVIWLLRFAIFFAVWYAFAVFYLFYIFPEEDVHLPKTFRHMLLPLMAAVSLLTLTPYVFERIGSFTSDGRVNTVVNGPGMIAFGPIVITLVFGGLYLLFQKTRHVSGQERVQYRLMLAGAVITYSFIVLCNFILPAFFNISFFVPFGAVFTLPFIMLTAYAIIRHGLFNVKVVSTEILTFALSVVLLFEVIFSTDALTIAYRIVVFVMVLGAGILLIRSVRSEVQQRERVSQLAQSLEKANSRLKELDQLKTEFLSVASHQLRTPLSIIKGYTSLMEEGAYGKPTPEMLPILHNIDVSNERLIKLVDEFLNVSRIEQGRTQFHFAPVDMNVLLDGIVTELQEKANTKQIVLDLKMPKNLSGVIADEDKIRHGIYNFVDNAIKYSPISSHIEIFIESKSNKLWIHVIDQGVGLDGKDLANLFQKFYRSPHVIHDVEGNGLGLFVVRQFVEGHNGKVWAKSKGINKGSDFGFWIPTTLSASPSQPPSSIAAKATVKTDKS